MTKTITAALAVATIIFAAMSVWLAYHVNELNIRNNTQIELTNNVLWGHEYYAQGDTIDAVRHFKVAAELQAELGQ